MRDFSGDHRWLSINTATVRKSRGVELPLTEIIEACARRGIRAISPWRDQVAAAGLDTVARLVRTHGLELSGYCRGGMFPASDAQGRQAARDDNRRAVDEACALGAPCLVLVVGGLPGALAGKAAHKDIALARIQVHDGIAELLDYARAAHMPLAIEPLHPMYASDRAVVSTLGQALDIAADFDADVVGAAVDTFHIWWDPQVFEQIARAGREGRIATYQVCDWKTPLAADVLLSRHYMGDGVIDFGALTRAVIETGYDRDIEVEIFNADIWADAPADVVRRTAEAFEAAVSPHLP